MGAEGLNSGSPACALRTSSTEPSPQTTTIGLYFFLPVLFVLLNLSFSALFVQLNIKEQFLKSEWINS